MALSDGLASFALTSYGWLGLAAYPLSRPLLAYRAAKGKEDRTRRMERFGFAPRYLVAVNARVVKQARAELAALTAIKFIGARAAAHLPEDAFTYHVPVLNPPVNIYQLQESARLGGVALEVFDAAIEVEGEQVVAQADGEGVGIEYFQLHGRVDGAGFLAQRG
mgnify:CR=1 FL=1